MPTFLCAMRVCSGPTSPGKALKKAVGTVIQSLRWGNGIEGGNCGL